MKTTAHNLTEIFHGSNCFAAATALCWRHMNEENENPRRYKWPWFVLAAVVLFIALAVGFVGFKANQIKQERGFDAPPPAVGK
jgi:hypothetical protein